MAKKRLNRKVALIGSAVILLLIFAAIAVILQLNRDPEKFIKDGDTALAAKDYDAAIRNYNKARGFAKTDELRIDIFSKLIDIYIETNQWRNALGFWNAIVKIEPGNTKARFGKLEYIYTVADNGAARVWQDVAEQADEFLEIADDSILEANIKDLVTYGLKDTDSYRERYGKYENVDTKLGPYLYLLRGRAIYEITKIGAVTEQKDSITKAISDMERSVELAPYNVDAYWYLAQAIITKGKILASMGNPQEKQNAARQAGELLEKAVELLPENVKAHINRLSIQPAVKQMVGVEQIKQLEPEYLSLTEKFPTSPQAYAALCAFYRVMGYKSLDNAVIAIEKAIELDRENVAYVKVATNLIYQKFSIYRAQDDFDKAIGLAKNGLTLPGCQDIPGPFQSINRVNRISLNVFLAKCYLEQILDPALPMDDEQRQLWLKNAEIYVHEVEQILGSGENPVFVIWQGMLELAKGNKTLATKKLYAVYEQLKAAEAINKTTGSAQLCYTLAGIFKDTQELGAVREFLINALNANIAQAKPKVYLELAEVFLKLNDPTTALSIINIFEEKYDADKKSQSLRTKAYIVSRQFDQAQRQLDESSADDPNTIKMKLALTQAKMQQLQMTISQKQMQDSLATLARAKKADTQSDIIAAELQTHSDELVNLVEKLLVIEPNSVKGRDIAVLCENYLKNDRIEDAKNLTTKYLALYPDDTIAQLYLQILAEPDPAKVSLQRRSEIEEQNLLKIKDLPKRLFNLAMFYQRNKNNEKAVETLREILQIPDDDLRIPIKERQLSNEETFATELLFNIALGNIDWDMATMITEFATRENLDQCEGDFFAARLAAAKEQYNEALTRLDEALKQRPVFSQAYMLRSSVNAALGNEQASIADIQKAASLNPFDGNIAKQLAMTLFRYNKKLGDDALSEQTIEIRNALDRALLMNPADLDLLSFYAEYISSTEPFRALAIRQNLHRVSPGMSNALLLGRLATKLAVDDTDASRKEALFNIAKSAFEQADRIDPQDKQMLLNYAEYYRARGQEQLAKQLLIESEDKKLLWEHYFRSGKYSDAQSVLEQLYQADAKDPDVLRGFILVADKTTDAEAVKKYSQELLQVDESIDNYLIQIQAFLKVGLIKEVEHKLASFREKHPDESRAFLLEAWLAMKQGQLEKALQMTNRHLEVDQDSMDGWRLRGEINFYLTNYNQAILDLKKSKSLTDDPVTRVALARAYLRANRDEDAITELRSTINLDEAPMQARILLEEIYTRLDREQELKKLYDETLDEFPDDIGWYNRAAKFAMLKNELERAEKLFAQAWEKSKLGGNGSLAAFDGYLGALMFTGKYDKLFELAGKNVDGELASIAFLKMAQAKVKLDEKDVAAKYFRKAVEKTGTNQILAADILQEMLEQLGQQEVLEYCNQRLAENPNSLVANLTMFTLKRIAGEYNKAIDYIDNCLKIVGPDSIYAANYMAKKAMVLQAVYNKTADKKYLNSAITLYESLLEKMPNNSNVLNNLAYMMAEADIRLEKALEYAERAYKATPNNANFMDTYSYALYKNQQYEKAAEFLQAAMQIYERNKISAEPVVYEHLGQIYEKLGEQNKAIVAYKQALEADKDNLSEIVRNRITEAIQRLSK